MIFFLEETKYIPDSIEGIVVPAYVPPTITGDGRARP